MATTLFSYATHTYDHLNVVGVVALNSAFSRSLLALLIIFGIVAVALLVLFFGLRYRKVAEKSITLEDIEEDVVKNEKKRGKRLGGGKLGKTLFSPELTIGNEEDLEGDNGLVWSGYEDENGQREIFPYLDEGFSTDQTFAPELAISTLNEEHAHTEGVVLPENDEGVYVDFVREESYNSLVGNEKGTHMFEGIGEPSDGIVPVDDDFSDVDVSPTDVVVEGEHFENNFDNINEDGGVDVSELEVKRKLLPPLPPI